MEALRGCGPALALGTWGMSEIVEERLARIEGKRDNIAEWVEFWAKKMVAGEHVSCPSSCWKAAVHRAEQLQAAARGQQQEPHNSSATAAASPSVTSLADIADDSNNNDTTGNDWNNPPHVFSDEQKDALMRKLVGGNYELIGSGNGSSIGGEKNGLTEQILRRYAARNGTYFPEDGEALVRRARLLLDRAPPPPKVGARG